MKYIMTLIVTLSLAFLSLQASSPSAKNGFTVTQIALDTAQENEEQLLQALEAIDEDKNASKKYDAKEAQ